MKRIVCVVVALMLFSTAFAATTSKTTADTSTAFVDQKVVETYSEKESSAYIAVDKDEESKISQETSAALERLLEAVDSATSDDMTEKELADAVSKTVDAYCQSNDNTIETVDGEPTTLTKFLIPEGKIGTVTIDEIFPVRAAHFSAVINDTSVMIPATFTVVTVYEEGERLALLIGFPRSDGSIQWIAMEGIYNGEVVEVDIPGDIVFSIQNSDGAMVAISSADIEE